MELTLIEETGFIALEGQPEQPCIIHVDDTRRLLEECFAQGVNAVLLYAPNLPRSFFDLSSGQAGSILQTLQNYRVRLAVVCLPGSVTLSSRFKDMLAETQHGRAFGLFETRAAACAWLMNENVGRGA